MSKKKLNNRLDKLFGDFDKEPEAKSKRSKKNGTKPPQSSKLTVKEQPTNFGTRDLSILKETSTIPAGNRKSSSAMLSTAFRTDENSWATLKVIDELEERKWGTEEQLLIKQVADQLSQALENARLFQETQRSAEEQAALNAVLAAANQSIDIKEILSIVLKKVLEVLKFEGGLISIFNEARAKLELAERIGMPGKGTDDLEKMLEKSLSGIVYNTGESLAINDLRKGAPCDVKSEIKAGLYGFYGVPLIVKGKTLGTLSLYRNSTVGLTKEELSLAQAIANQLGFTIENAQLFDESRKFRLGLERSADAVFMTDIQGNIVYANPSFKTVYGYSVEEVLGKNPRIIKSGQVPKEEFKIFWDTLLNKETVSWEIINKRKDGKLIPIDGTNSPILDANDNILGFLAIHSDITVRKEAEEALNRRNEYLAASGEIGTLVTSTLDLNVIYDRSVNLIVERFGFYHTSIFIIDESGFNAVLKESTGEVGEKLKQQKHSIAIDSKSLVGKSSASGETVINNNTALESIVNPSPLLSETRSEAAIPLKSGKRVIGTIDIHSTEINAFTDDNIAILQLLADQIAVGIDNARSYNIAQQAVEEMREVDRLKSQFLANMSHELRTPLNSIIGFARVILKGIDGPITELQQQDLTAIFNSGQHLLGLINDILDLSRIDAGKMELTFEDVNINELIISVMSTAAGLIKDKPIELKRDIPEKPLIVRADAMRIRQVLINFLSNAAKFTEEGEITVKVTIEEGAGKEPLVLVSVSDTGEGIAKKDHDKLFKPFSQVDDSFTRKAGGTGLGLSICNHLIEMHGGQIGVHSSLGKGSTFYFSIPISQTKIEPTRPEDGRLILAIDDDPKVISMYKRYLEPKGYKVIGLKDPSKVTEQVKDLNPFAITLDIMMPDYDGWQILSNLKSSAETRDIPVIICSIVEDEDKGYNLGATDYLVKPVLEDDLVSSLDRLNGDGSIREVLIIDDNPNDLRLLGKMLSEQGKYKPILAEGGPAGWNSLSSNPPHAVILDLFMPEMNGFNILENLRKDEKLKDLPVIIITGADLSAEEQKQVDNLGNRLLQKSSLKEKDLINSIENALNRVSVDPN
ncbi:MAG: response regulator [Anaerolineae bacterium]|nr:response regulator [Anaerolineae bacterium]